MGSDRGAAPGAAATAHDGLRTLREELAKAVQTRAHGRIQGMSTHFGEDYQHGSDPEAVAYQTTGGHFHWVAFGFAPWRMWDLHLGCVAIDDRHLSVGFHISERAAPVMKAELERLGAEIGATVQHQKAAVEYQANLPPIAVDRVPIHSLADTVAELCHKYSQAANKVDCPPEMRADVR
jgi:hypothetical protein